MAEIAVALAIFFLNPSFAIARAGGGEGFGGGGGGGGGGHGGGGIGILIYYWIWFCIDYPYIGLPVTIGVLIMVYKGHQTGMSAYNGSVIRRGLRAGEDNIAWAAARAMRDADGSDNADAFTQRVRTAFMKIQKAWCDQDLGLIRPFVSDGVYERFSLQIDEQKALQYRDHTDQITAQSVLLVEFTQGAVFDVATVCIQGSAADYRTDLKTGRRISGSGQVEPFVEYWVWIRRHGFKGDANKPGLIEGNCPNCGAAIEMNQSGQCAHCKAMLRSGEFDWVLVEITQESEWQPDRYNPTPSVVEFQKTDPGFSRPAVEDICSVMFWRKATADRVGKIDPLRKIADADFCRNYAASLAAEPDGSRAFYGDCAVGGVQLLGVVPGEGEDNAVVLVTWEGERIVLHPNRVLELTGERIHVHSVFILKRKSGVASDPGRSLSSAHCPNCGAPVTSDTSVGCAFCGTVLNDGSRGWVLTAVTSAASALGLEWVRRAKPVSAAADNISRKGLVTWAVKVAAADGTVDADEREMLRSLAGKCRVDLDLLDRMIHMALVRRLDVPDPPDAATARLWLGAMAAEAMVHGQARPPEAELLQRAGQRFGISDEDVKAIIAREYEEHLANAKSELRAARQNGD